MPRLVGCCDSSSGGYFVIFRRSLTIAPIVAMSMLGVIGPVAAASPPPRPAVTHLSASSISTEGGGTITVSGHNFTKVRSVHFGTTAGSHVKVESSTSIEVTPPAHAEGRVAVTVTTAAGMSKKVSADRVKYVTFLSWGSPLLADPRAGIQALSCPLATFCKALDSEGFATTYNGHKWTPSTKRDDKISTPSSVSCVSKTFCVAVDQMGYALVYNGRTNSWTKPKLVDSGNALTSVSCSTATMCGAVDNEGNELIFNGSKWSKAKAVDSHKGLMSISCPSPTFCAAVDDNGHATIFNGTSWRTSSQIDKAGELTSVSCPSRTFCAAVDNAGNALVYNGKTWTAPKNIDATNDVDAVSCPTTSFCVATDDDGNAITYNLGAWGAPASIDGDVVLSPLSCPTTQFCVAGAESGDVVQAGPVLPV